MTSKTSQGYIDATVQEQAGRGKVQPHLPGPREPRAAGPDRQGPGEVMRQFTGGVAGAGRFKAGRVD